MIYSLGQIVCSYLASGSYPGGGGQHRQQGGVEGGRVKQRFFRLKIV